MIVCLCHRISDRDIRREAAAGCPSFEALQDELRVATSCGACHDCAREVFDAQAGPRCTAADHRRAPEAAALVA